MNDKKNEIILVTGGNGLVGQKLIYKLSSIYTTYALVHTLPKDPLQQIHYLPIDFSRDWSVENLPQKVSAIVHLAQSAHYRDMPERALELFQVNIESTARLLNYARQAGAKKFIYASSGGVYGNSSQAFIESEPIVPSGQLGYYLGSKACGEILVQSYKSVFDVFVIRPFFIYGPAQKRGMLIPRLLDSVATGKPIKLQGDSGIRINPIHVDDAVSAIAASLDLDESATFNIAGPDVLSIRDICLSMGRYLGVEPIFEQESGEANDLIADISAMRKFLHDPVLRLDEYLHDVKL